MTRNDTPGPVLGRRAFMGTTLAAAFAVGAAVRAQEQPAPAPRKKIKLGVVGNGGRGGWIASLFKEHGGYEMHAVADYFQNVADACGDRLGVDKSRRFSGLSGYKKLIASGVEAVALEVPPYFFPEQARAVIDAGLHLYMAKPVAVDAWGCLEIAACGKDATAKKRCMLVDYQMPTDPAIIEVAKRIREGGVGTVAYIATVGLSGGFPDPAKTATIESRLTNLIWVNDIALGGDNVVNYDIHCIDAAYWLMGQKPVAATGLARIARPEPHGDGRDTISILYECPDGLIWNHQGDALPNLGNELSVRVWGTKAQAYLDYYSRAYLRGGEKQHNANVENLYHAGAVRNIAAFYNNIMENKFENETVARAVDTALICILGREAAARRARVTMDELIKEKQRLTVDLTGLKT